MRAFGSSIRALMLRNTLDAHSLRFIRSIHRPKVGVSEGVLAAARTPEWQRMVEEIVMAFQLASTRVDHG